MIFFVAPLLLFGAGCKSSRPISDTNVQRMDVEDLEKELSRRRVQMVLIDVRSHEKYAAEHIPGAISIPLPDIRRGDGRLAGAKLITVYADGWNDMIGQAAAKKLLVLGYKNIYCFHGGIELWKDAQKPLVTAP